MKKLKKIEKVDTSDISEFDFSKSWRNPYAKRLRERTNIVIIEPTLTKYFPNSQAVNNALRSVVASGKPRRRRVAAA